METQKSLDYDRIAKAITFIQDNFKKQPSLAEIADQVHLSPYHFQRTFKDWAGVSPKKFLQYLSLEHAKSILDDGTSTIMDASFETGLSGTGRLHDLFVSIEGMTPGEYKNGGRLLSIYHTVKQTPFGKAMVAATDKGICHLSFFQDEKEELIRLKALFPMATFHAERHPHIENGLAIFSKGKTSLSEIKLHLKGTEFQLKVWESLLKIPEGKLSSYGTVAAQMDSPGATRAVGTAIGKNPIAYLIPCHRVIRATGDLGQYRWGSPRKAAIVGWEAARVSI
ncbi:methylated-DNA--[protein]-cysteine S-methyltransferase [Aureisphaera galaxeae]|uniref:methylated-DNA--[protein]-cysteine S-methyltransferase n=1 Tax=Aureisphaera galaxeae TaxID=1538023 RepID=UPI00235037E6|nr:methylated-DNA--[protein]-cysteine S-methyltransferase [Aureisphaera galaxeae]MDC8005173.1 methylated-DNA--[protein]-cysteine S-methyltransferase [Aureisphaera galaxeae]